jgi:hypothetical protein
MSNRRERKERRTMGRAIRTKSAHGKNHSKTVFEAAACFDNIYIQKLNQKDIVNVLYILYFMLSTERWKSVMKIS